MFNAFIREDLYIFVEGNLLTLILILICVICGLRAFLCLKILVCFRGKKGLKNKKLLKGE